MTAPAKGTAPPANGVRISMVASALATACHDAAPGAIVEGIRAGKWRRQVAAVRKALAADGKEAADELKRRLPGILWAGTFSRRANDGLKTHAGFLCADLDGIPERVGELHDALRADPHVAAAFVSPSGNGLKAIFRIFPDAKRHGASFAAVRERLRKEYDISPDEKAKDLARLCFVSADPAAWWNAAATPLDPLPEIPQAPVANHAPPPNGDTLPPSAEKLLASGAPQGYRNAAAFDLACQCRDAGKSQAEAEAVVAAFAGRCNPPLPETEARAAVRSAYTQAPRPPARGAPGWTPQADTAEQAEARPKLTLRSPDDILAMRFDDSDIILSDRLLAVGQSLVLAAAGGVGKSRLLLQLAACVITGRKFLHFDTHNPELRWLILQTENSNRRLQHDLSKLRAWLADDWPKFNERLTVHTLETDTDGLVALDDPAAHAAIADAIADTLPDVVAFDPLNDFAIGDLNKDADMRLTLTTLSRLVRRGNPHRSPVVLHHALTGKGGAVKVTGYDRASFARNSKALHAWTRAQVNLAPVDPDTNDRLVVACGKLSNGPEFQTFVIRLNPDSLIYECDPSVDVTEWAKDITGQASREPLMNPERVAELCRMPMTKGELAKVIMEDCGCYRGSAYRYITRAEQARKLRFNKDHETYSAK